MEKRGSSFRLEFNIPEDAVLIGTVGNLYPVKGHKYLIRAFADIYFSYSKTFLVLVGRGGEENNLKQLVADLNIPGNRVIFTGFRNDIENIMNAFDLYVQPSLSEGHPVAVLEAMSLGIPVVATAVGGIPEIIGQDRYGTLVNSESCEELHRCIEGYLHSPDMFMEKSSDAKNYTRDAFSVEKMAGNYLDVYRQALAF
jgi:glycosyltransferase involved in cell wall biosynthesis